MKIKHQNYLEVFHHQSQVDRFYKDDNVKVTRSVDEFAVEIIEGRIHAISDQRITLISKMNGLNYIWLDNIVAIQKVGYSE